MKTMRTEYLRPASWVVPVRLRGILMSSGTSEQSGVDAGFQGYEVGDSLYLD